MPGSRRSRMVWAALAVVAVAAAVRWRAVRAPDVLVIVVDTLRADRLGSYGNPDGLTPFLDSLAERGTVFTRAYAQTSWTSPSVASLLTSRYQSQHGITAFNTVLADAETTLPETLRAHGYATAGFSANGLIAPKVGFAQGYDVYRAHWVQQRADQPNYLWQPVRAGAINAEALAWLDLMRPDGRRGKPVFLYLQYMEPHTPYFPTDEALERVLKGRPRPDPLVVNAGAFTGWFRDENDEGLRDVRTYYDAAVASLDDALRDLFAELERRGFLDHALVVITADHGEEFKEHGFMGHEKTLYGEVIHVPLIVLTPRQAGPRRVDRVASLVDVAPTVLDAAGIARPATYEGESLVGEFCWPRRACWRQWAGGVGRPAREPAAYSELIKTGKHRRHTPHERALVMGDGKIILGVGGEREFYDLRDDPAERDADALEPGARTALEARLDAIRSLAERHRSPVESATLDEATKDQLRALGYVE